ncbi:MAG: hypothetical protein ABI690_13170 [Chloroflexota bacterium]
MFELLKQISQDEFLSAWREEEQGKDDPYTQTRIREHESYIGLDYYMVKLTEEGLTKLILPNHTHDNRELKKDGEFFWDVITKFLVPENIPQSCYKRIQCVRDELTKHASEYALLDTSYTLGRVYYDPRLGNPNSDAPNNKNQLYAGNFHRFAGYGTWVKEHGYQPVKVFFTEARMS